MPRGQSSRTTRPSSSKPKAPPENAIDWSTKSEMTNDHKSFRRPSRRDSNFLNDRKRANSLDNLPEDGPVSGTLPQRNTDPNLANIDFGDPNLYDEVLIDLFACVAKKAGNGGGANAQQQQQQRRNSTMIPRTNKSNESLGSLARMSMANESLNSLSRHANKTSRQSMRRNSNWEMVSAHVRNSQGSTLPSSQFGNSRSHENLDHAFQHQKQQRRNSVMKPNRSDGNLEVFEQQQGGHEKSLDHAFQQQKQQRRNSVMKPNRSHGNLEVFEQQQQHQQGGPAKPKEGSKDMVNMLKVAAKMKLAMNQTQNREEQDRIQRTYAAQLSELRKKHEEARRLSDDAQRRQSDGSKRSSLSNSGISALTASGESGDEKRLSNASGRSGGSGELRSRLSNISGDGSELDPNIVMAEIIPANVPSRQRRRRSIAKSIKGMQKRRNSKVDIQGLSSHRNSNADLHGMATRKNSNVDLQAMPNNYSNEPLFPLGLKQPRRDSRASLGSGPDLAPPKRVSRSNSGDGLKVKLFDEMMNASEPKLDNSNKSKNDKVKDEFNKHNDNSNAKKDRPETDQQKMKLYDEILSASNTDRQTKVPKTPGQDGTASTMQTSQTLPLLDASIKSMRSFGSKTKKEAGRCGRCRKKDKKLMLGLVFLLLGLIGGYLIFLYMPGLRNDSNDGSDTENGYEEPIVEVITTPTSPADNSSVIVPPPPDIEGMCSASNLPGSLSACLAACLPSACCYSGFSGPSCVEENQPESKAACASYRPYCDIFYDEEVWIDGTEGVLRYITDEKMKMCSGMGGLVISGASSSSSLTNPSSGVKRLRGHTISDQSSADNPRSLLALAPQETCENYCISARCCSAPIITNQEVSGVILSPTGVYTNSTTGEYVMTNCQKSNSMNVQLCARYEAFCSTDDSQPIVSGVNMSSVTPSTKPIDFSESASPIKMPTSLSKSPVRMPVPVPWPTNEFTPSIPTPSATNAPITLNPTSTSPISKEGSRGPTPKITQASYPPSSTIQTSSINETMVAPSKVPTMISGGSLSPTQSASSVATNSSDTPSKEVPLAPSGDIQKACTNNQATFLIATGDPQARKECVKACQDGLCCFAIQLGYDWMKSCYAGNEQVCTEYAPCLILQEEGTDNTSDLIVSEENTTTTTNSTDVINITNVTITKDDNSTESLDQPAKNNNSTLTSDGPPIPDTDLSVLCSEDSITQTSGLKKCIKACDLGRCCSSSDNATGCFSTHAETCYLYTSCNNAYNILYSD